jgi:hypothetical protein
MKNLILFVRQGEKTPLFSTKRERKNQNGHPCVIYMMEVQVITLNLSRLDLIEW